MIDVDCWWICSVARWIGKVEKDSRKVSVSKAFFFQKESILKCSVSAPRPQAAHVWGTNCSKGRIFEARTSAQKQLQIEFSFYGHALWRPVTSSTVFIKSNDGRLDTAQPWLSIQSGSQQRLLYMNHCEWVGIQDAWWVELASIVCSAWRSTSHELQVQSKQPASLPTLWLYLTLSLILYIHTYIICIT